MAPEGKEQQTLCRNRAVLKEKRFVYEGSPKSMMAGALKGHAMDLHGWDDSESPIFLTAITIAQKATFM